MIELDRRTCDRARRSRDPRFDGRFFIGVTSTGIYCRPICPARAPLDENVRYFATAAAAEAAGFRPCLRCRPEASPGTPAWNGTSAVVSRALRLIGEGALDRESVERLAERLGVTDRHLRRLFRKHLGATPLEVALTRRVHRAKKLLDETSVPFEEIAFASGFGSLRRFHAQIRRTFRRTPTELRRSARRRAPCEPGCYRFRLAFRPPYDWNGTLALLRERAIPGVESVDAFRYRRTIAVDETAGVIEVRRSSEDFSLDLLVRLPEPRCLLVVVERVRRLFDLDCDPAAVTEHLRDDPWLRSAVARCPGIRIPGAWDGLELAVASLIGVPLAARIAAAFGSPLPDCGEGPSRVFPSSTRLASSRIERTGVSTEDAEAIRNLAKETSRGGLCAALRTTSGVDGRIAEYVSMRASGEPDAFPHRDPVLLRRAERWRPWRGYAFVLLARSGARREVGFPRRKHANDPAGDRSFLRSDGGR